MPLEVIFSSHALLPWEAWKTKEYPAAKGISLVSAAKTEGPTEREKTNIRRELKRILAFISLSSFFRD
jgi:hypothetical protein